MAVHSLEIALEDMLGAGPGVPHTNAFGEPCVPQFSTGVATANAAKRADMSMTRRISALVEANELWCLTVD